METPSPVLPVLRTFVVRVGEIAQDDIAAYLGVGEERNRAVRAREESPSRGLDAKAMRMLWGAQALALATFLSACQTQAEQPQLPEGPPERVDLVRASRTVEQAIDAARGALSENAEAQLLGCQELCAPSHINCDRAPVAVCRVEIRAIVPGSDLLDMLAVLDFFVHVDGMSMEVSGNFLDECDVDVGNCHIQISGSEAIRRLGDACLDADQRAHFTSLRWDARTQSVIWHISSADRTEIGVVSAGSEGKPVCLDGRPKFQRIRGDPDGESLRAPANSRPELLLRLHSSHARWTCRWCGSG
jgi:hypothetical protein